MNEEDAIEYARLANIEMRATKLAEDLKACFVADMIEHGENLLKVLEKEMETRHEDSASG